MYLSFTGKKNIRKNFGKLKESLSIPNLIEVQKNSYKQLTKFDPSVESHLVKGFDRVFKSIFPIEDVNDKATLEYISYRFDKPKFDVEECISRGLTYSAALKCTLRLVVYEINVENNTKGDFFKNRVIRTKMVNVRSKFNQFVFHLSNPFTIFIRNFFLKRLVKNKKFLESYLGKIYNN